MSLRDTLRVTGGPLGEALGEVPELFGFPADPDGDGLVFGLGPMAIEFGHHLLGILLKKWDKGVSEVQLLAPDRLFFVSQIAHDVVKILGCPC